MPLLPPLRPDARLLGALLCLAGLLLLGVRSLLAGALGLELLAAAFWCWARSASDRDEQLPRWAWLRRPATALWLATAIHALLAGEDAGFVPALASTRALLSWVRAGAVVWAGLELLAALPLARPYSDRPGPLLAFGPWLPVLLPSAGFLVLWRHAEHWAAVDGVRRIALLLLAVTLALAALRAFSRQRWVAALRWLTVAECALAGMLVAMRSVHAEISLMLWLGAAGGRAALLAGELRGAAPRRRPVIYSLWRLSGWVALASLSWPLLIALGFGGDDPIHPVLAIVVALAVLLLAWITVRRLIEAPERRAVVRRESALPLTQFAALVTIAIGPVALVMAWWSGFEARWPGAGLALLPALVGGAVAWALERLPAREAEWPSAYGGAARGAAHAAFQTVVAVERGAMAVLGGAGRALLSPSRDLHTGDAHEYLLFLVGLSVLGLVLPLLR
jgi:hypothetical protein